MKAKLSAGKNIRRDMKSNQFRTRKCSFKSSQIDEQLVLPLEIF